MVLIGQHQSVVARVLFPSNKTFSPRAAILVSKTAALELRVAGLAGRVLIRGSRAVSGKWQVARGEGLGDAAEWPGRAAAAWRNNQGENWRRTIGEEEFEIRRTANDRGRRIRRGVC